MSATPGMPPQLLFALVLLGVTSGLAFVLFVFQRPPGNRCRPIAPHPSQPANMLVFVALPTVLTFTSLVVRFGLVVTYVEPINSPDSIHRLIEAPVELDDGYGPGRLVYPENAANLTADAVRRVEEAESSYERIRAIRELSWWTGVCPNYGPFTIPVLLRALGNPDPAVKAPRR